MKLTTRLHRKLADLGVYKPERAAKGLKILLYHGVVPDFDPTFKSRFIGVDDFRRHLENYKRNFNVVSLSDAFQGKLRSDVLNLVLTFDDGYRNNYQYAAPLLQEFNLPAAFFITGMNAWNPAILWADMLDLFQRFNDMPLVIGGSEFRKDERGFYRSQSDGKYLNKVIKEKGSLEFKLQFYEACMQGDVSFLGNASMQKYHQLMEDAEIRELAENTLFTIGSHGFYHNNLGNIPLKEAVDEVLKSKKYLEDLIGKNVNSIAFPDGSYSEKLPEALHHAGFDNQLACDFLYSTDLQQQFLKSRHEISWFRSSMGIFNYELVKR
jgi:peptidoglycan/xylan/chitin deacetylase (PgdA/CDA1 family)